MTIVICWKHAIEVLTPNGTPADLASAQAAAREARDGRRVYTYPRTEADPVGRAKRDFAADGGFPHGYFRRYHPLAG